MAILRLVLLLVVVAGVAASLRDAAATEGQTPSGSGGDELADRQQQKELPGRLPRQQARTLLQQQRCGPGRHTCAGRCVNSTNVATCGTRCTPCPKPRANGVATCAASGRCGIKCNSGFQQSRGGNGAVTCVRARVACPPGQEGNASGKCKTCAAGFYKDTEGPGPCMRCPPGTATLGSQPADGDSVADCRPISCPAGRERDLVVVGGGCRVCPANTYKASAGTQPCSPCPPGTVTAGGAAADHDEEADCFALACPPGEELDPATGNCRVCLANTFNLGNGSGPCTRCPDGTLTLGTRPSDHDSPNDCFPGGLQPGNSSTGTFISSLLQFEDMFSRSLDNTGRGGGGKGGSGGGKGGGGKGGRRGACLVYFDTAAGCDAKRSEAVAHLAGSPTAFRASDAAATRAGVVLVGATKNQGNCATCVNAVISSAAEAAVAAARRIDARALNISGDFAYHCTGFLGDLQPGRSCSLGWSFNAALATMRQIPNAFFLNSSCVAAGGATDLATMTYAELQGVCTRVNGTQCADTGIKCISKSFEGLWDIQRHLRRYGSALTRLKVTPEFKEFYEKNRTGVFNTTTSAEDSGGFWHAVLLIGYDNDRQFWHARNSWGSKWGDDGNFRIAFGALGTGHPEETYGLICNTTSSDPAVVGAWSDRWPVVPDSSDPSGSCFLYNASSKDTISGIADHFGVGIVRFISDNVQRGLIPITAVSDDEGSRQEPQLVGPWGGTVFKVCDIPSNIFNSVAQDPCDAPGYCNGRQSKCTAGRCECKPGFSGARCETLSPKSQDFTFDGANYTLVTEPRLSWHEAERFCQSQGQHLVRLHSALHAEKFSHVVLSSYKWERFWIGLNDEQSEGNFVWSADVPGASPMSWRGPFPWFSNEPDNAPNNGDCVRFVVELLDNLKARVRFDDNPCDWGQMFACSDGVVPLSACTRHPCAITGEAEPTCSDNAGATMADGAQARTCTCPTGFVYEDDTLGCVQPVDAREFTVDGVLHRLFLAPRLTWTGADSVCRKNGTQLVEPRSSFDIVQLQAAVLTALKPRSYEPYWIGLTDRAREGEFRWSSDGSFPTDTKWYIGTQPDNACGPHSLPAVWVYPDGTTAGEECLPGEDCVEAWTEDGSWNDQACFEHRAFVCSERA